MSWNQWSKRQQNEWQKGNKGKGKSNAPPAKEKQGLPAYDSTSASSPAQQESSKDATLKSALVEIIQENNLQIPERYKHIMEEDVNEKINYDQRVLNSKRKLNSRLERLRKAATKKEEQWQAFRSQVREHLLKEQERFQQEQKEIQDAITQTQLDLDKLMQNNGMETEEMTAMPENKTKDVLDELLKVETPKATDPPPMPDILRKTQQDHQLLMSQMGELQQQMVYMVNALAGPMNGSPLKSTPLGWYDDSTEDWRCQTWCTRTLCQRSQRSQRSIFPIQQDTAQGATREAKITIPFQGRPQCHSLPHRGIGDRGDPTGGWLWAGVRELHPGQVLRYDGGEIKNDKEHMGLCYLPDFDLQPWLSTHGHRPTMSHSFTLGEQLTSHSSAHGTVSQIDPSIHAGALLQRGMALTVFVLAEGWQEDFWEDIQVRRQIYEQQHGPANYANRWNWANAQCGLAPPEAIAHFYVHRSVHPVTHMPTALAFNFDAGTDAVLAVRRIEMRWTDLTPTDGRTIFWQLIRAHDSIQTSEAMDVSLPHFILSSQQEDQLTNVQAAIFVEIHSVMPMGTTAHAHVRTVHPRNNAFTFIQAFDRMTECTYAMQCTVYHNNIVIQHNFVWAWDGDFVVLRMRPVEILAPSDSEAESPEPIAAARSPFSTSSTADSPIVLPGGTTPPAPGSPEPEDPNLPIAYHIHGPDFGGGRRLSSRTIGKIGFPPERTMIAQWWPDLGHTAYGLYDVDESYNRDIAHLPPLRVMLVISTADFAQAPRLRGVIVHIRLNEKREIKSVPLARETSELGILAWTRLLNHCARYRLLECKVWHNNDRIRGSEQVYLNHADYIRVEALNRNVDMPTPALIPIPEPHLQPDLPEGESLWPKPPRQQQVATSASRSTRSQQRDQLHAAYWIFNAWWINFLLFMILYSMPNPPQPGRKRRGRHRSSWKKTRTALWLILLISADQAIPVATLHLLPAGHDTIHHTWPSSQPVPSFRHVNPYERLPPPGNPGCTGERQIYQDDVAKDIWKSLRGMYRPIATPMRGALSSIDRIDDTNRDQPIRGHSAVTVRLAEHISPPEAKLPDDDIPAISADVTRTWGLDAPNSDYKFKMYVGDDFMDDRQGLTVPWPTTPTPWPTDFIDEQHPAAFHNIYTNLALDDEDMRYIHIFTDGSAGKCDDGYAAAWAFVVFYSTTASSDMTEAKYQQWYGGRSNIDALDPQWVGATEMSSKTAEAEALIWAMLWVLQLEDNRPVHIHSDALSVLSSATGHWTCHPEDALMRRVRATHQLLSTYRSMDALRFSHIKAHDGHAGNEFGGLHCCVYQDARRQGTSCRRFLWRNGSKANRLPLNGYGLCLTLMSDTPRYLLTMTNIYIGTMWRRRPTPHGYILRMTSQMMQHRRNYYWTFGSRHIM